MFCLSCRRLWPSDALYCGQCGRSFGGRVCRSGHLSPPSARRCVRCNDAALTTPAACVSVAWLYRLLAWLCVLAAIREACFHPSAVGRIVEIIGRWGFVDVLDVRPQAVVRFVGQALPAVILALVVLVWLPDPLGGRVRRAVLLLGRAAFRCVGYVAAGLLRVVQALVSTVHR